MGKLPWRMSKDSNHWQASMTDQAETSITSRTAIIEITKLVRAQFEHEATGHDWWHIRRVWGLSRSIWRHTGGDLLVVELAALLHEAADWKFHVGNGAEGVERVVHWLSNFGVSTETIESIRTIILNISFKGAKVDDAELSLEGRIVQDADRLDAIGAIGVARTFTFGGAKKAPIYTPGVTPLPSASFAEYQTGSAHTVNHFYEKLLLLRDRLHTPYARELARSRHEFMEKFLQQFLAEWNEDLISQDPSEAL